MKPDTIAIYSIEIAYTWWQGKGNTLFTINAQNILEYLGSLYEGECIYRIFNVNRALFYLAQVCISQKVS
jgi:hypothetical protein